MKARLELPYYQFLCDSFLFLFVQWLQLATLLESTLTEWVLSLLAKSHAAVNFSASLTSLVIDPLSRIAAAFQGIQWDHCSTGEPAPAPQHKLLWRQVPVRCF